jgi:hypothetical protein
MDKVTLAQRKTLLLARSSLYRLTLAREADVLRESLHWRNVLSSAAHSGAWRPLALAALLLVAGRGRIAGFLRLATRALAVAKLVQAVRAGRKDA